MLERFGKLKAKQNSCFIIKETANRIIIVSLIDGNAGCEPHPPPPPDCKNFKMIRFNVFPIQKNKASFQRQEEDLSKSQYDIMH